MSLNEEQLKDSVLYQAMVSKAAAALESNRELLATSETRARDFENLKQKYEEEVAALEVRASGRVTPAVLAPVRVSLPDKGGVRLEEVATVGVRDGTMLVVTVFEEQVSAPHVPRTAVPPSRAVPPRVYARSRP